MRLLVIDPCEFTRLGVKQLFAQVSDLEIWEARDVREALEVIGEHSPPVGVADIGPRDLSVLLGAHPHMKVVVFPARGEEALKRRALSLGAFAYVSKGDAIPVLIEALKAATSGLRFDEQYIDDFKLTDREGQVLELLGQGLTMVEVASQLGIAYKTVNNACHRLRDKLGLQGFADLVRYATEENKQPRGLRDIA